MRAPLLCSPLYLCLAGCTLLPLGGSPNSSPAGQPASVGHGLSEYRAAFHVHSYLSHDSDGQIQEIAEAAKLLGLDAVILTDHYKEGNIREAPRATHQGVLFVPGVETRGVLGGSVCAFPLQNDYNDKISKQERQDEYERQGAVLVLGHVEKIDRPASEKYSAFEVYNLHAEFTAASVLGLAWRFLFLPADAFFEGAINTPVENLAAWDREHARGLRLAALAGHDAHANIHILGAVIGTYPEVLRLFSNHILAPELTVEALTAAIRSGKTFIVFDYLADGTGFAFTYGPPEASLAGRATVGDEAPYDPGHTLAVSVPVPPDDGKTRILLLRDGQVFVEANDPRLTMKLPGPGTWRVEVYRDEKLWIVSTPIYLRAG